MLRIVIGTLKLIAYFMICFLAGALAGKLVELSPIGKLCDSGMEDLMS